MQIPIILHPNVRRKLLLMKAYTEGLRALILYTTFCMDQELVSEDEDAKKKWRYLVELLTPIAKAYTADKSFEACARSIQVHGGYGYCKEYKVEQFARDCKITAIYEGTNGIQAIDLFSRKIRMDQGEALKTIISEMRQTVDCASQNVEILPYAREVGEAISLLEEITRFLLERSSGDDAYLAFSWASSYLEIFGDIVLGWMLLWQAQRAGELLVDCDARDKRFYTRKMATAKFYIGSVLPSVRGKIDAISRFDHSFVEMREDLFAS